MDAAQERLTRDISNRLQRIDGIKAVVLGGSHARGLGRPDSDVDLGIYYSEEEPFQVEALRGVISDLSNSVPPVVTQFYEWGPWVNGGAWLTIDGRRLDLIYRNLEQVQRTIDDVVRGEFQHHFGQQPPYGFFSFTYLGEVFYCQVIHDPEGVMAKLKERVSNYPPALKTAIVDSYLWASEFSLRIGEGFLQRQDSYGLSGCMSRCALYLTQVLFALNETYFLSDKTAMAEAASLPKSPNDFSTRIKTALSKAGDPHQAGKSLVGMRTIHEEVVELAGDLYQPRYLRGDN